MLNLKDYQLKKMLYKSSIKVNYYGNNLRNKIEGKKESEKTYKNANELIEEEEENNFPEFNKIMYLKIKLL